MELTKQKIEQTFDVLNELDIDCWVIFVRETAMATDPAMELVASGLEATWQTFLIYTKERKAYALVGNFDQEDYNKSGYFTEVIPYTEGVMDDFQKLIKRINPKLLAFNFSTHNCASDGLSHGMYLLVQEYLKETEYSNRIISAEQIIGKLRSRKLLLERDLLQKAAEMADEVWHKAVEEIQLGMTEQQVAAVIEFFIKQVGGHPSFPTIVNAGAKTKPGHSAPTTAKLSGGDLLHVDFGIRYKGFCSDIQRLLYFKRPNEKEAPPELVDAFNLVRDIITETGHESKPGAIAYQIDNIARQRLLENRYEEYQHALGHQLGRDVHDGGTIIGPNWQRYGGTTSQPLEENNVFTLELEIMLPGIGCVGLEEDMYVTEKGAVFISPRQMELIIK